MGKLVNGEWTSEWYDTESTEGRFEREPTRFHEWIRADGSTDFRAEPGRYHLYVSYACPWACRTLIFRKLKELEDVISLSIVDPYMGEDGWAFSEAPGCIRDTVNGKDYLREVYLLADSRYTGRVTVPVLWDRELETIVNNESAEIIRMLNSEFDVWGRSDLDYYPQELRAEIDAINDRVYTNVNNGVYRCGFATTQEAYDEAFTALFATLAELEALLAQRRYLVGDRLTEADWRLFTTLVRFDPVYFGHFKCNLRRLVDYPNLWGYTRELYQQPGIAATVNLDHIKLHYYRSHETLNPSRIVPLGPEVDFTEAHDRG